ncbi:GNAT family N-acetyltransferase [filamentous cyanobacterium LEGE 11480]|uniref:GNAT family N-acetyltransferase n=1 Tax=Romeriopsis navalis LEGE 11480 TaxID=2777977 RepID=A0A928Z6M9_9CYAN|nr:GNAT family N-acetyltransferase [Romeriopsis navalis]MBE9032375.1 GNAT family N-acetyltransferase [Romeriopsis navalis LEGE 11480]
MLTIRLFNEADWNAVWPIVEPVFCAGETYPYSPDITQGEAFDVWIATPQATYIAEDEENGAILGTYYIKPNQPSQGSHVCNCGYIVAEAARGRGVASQMCEHSQQEAVRQGFRAMQYNLVVATNERAVRLWQKMGFQIVGTLHGAFNHSVLGYVDAHIMYKELVT